MSWKIEKQTKEVSVTTDYICDICGEPINDYEREQTRPGFGIEDYVQLRVDHHEWQKFYGECTDALSEHDGKEYHLCGRCFREEVLPHHKVEFLTLSMVTKPEPITIPASDIVDVRASTDDMLELAERVDRDIPFHFHWSAYESQTPTSKNPAVPDNGRII